MKKAIKIVFLTTVLLLTTVGCLASKAVTEVKMFGIDGNSKGLYIRADWPVRYEFEGYFCPIAVSCFNTETGKPFPIDWDVYFHDLLLYTVRNKSVFFTADYYRCKRPFNIQDIIIIVPHLPVTDKGHFYTINMVYIPPARSTHMKHSVKESKKAIGLRSSQPKLVSI